ncbi:MAG: hypothetical protein IJQ82_16070 [Selenomonadaceae bacterium]|nr:hypothetical protein [Selenomonadaceae bacterium]
MTANFSAMNRAIIDYINSKIPKDTNQAKIGVVSGNRVIIGNKSYAYTPTVDLYFGDKSRVACILPDKANYAAVVGVL